jgi:PAS domain S-box-containing protein
VIALFASEPGVFTDPILRLLDALSMDLSYALVTFDHREQRITAEHDLKTSELQYRRLFETAQDAILILDADTGKIVDANPCIQERLGYTLDYFVGKQLWELGFIRDKSFAKKAFHELETKGYIRYYDLPLETKTGRAMDVEFISNIYLVGVKRIIQCNIRDITDWKQTKDALFQANKKLNLLSSITRHDINNQMMILTGNLAMLEEGQPEPARNEYFRDAVSAAQRISAIIQFTREYEQIGRNDPVWQDCRNLVEMVAEQAPLGQVPVQNDLPAGMEVFVDPLIARVFSNLMDNAVRHGGMITTIRFSFLESGDDPLIVCEDDGVGISLQEKEKIFEQGFGKNTGLGLFLSREILGITGITITETGEPGKGARFEIVVPKGNCRFTRV